MNLTGHCSGINKEKLRLENQQKNCAWKTKDNVFFHPTKYMYQKKYIKN
jgi:hypothetical protein